MTRPTETTFVYSDAGLFEVELDGRIVRMLIGTPIEAAVRLGDDFLAVGEGRVSRVARDGGHVTRIAVLELPADASCQQAQPDLLPLAVQQARDVRVDSSSGVVCVRVSDRNENMMDVAVDYRITLADGRVESRVTWCGGVDGPGFECGAPLRAPAPARAVSGHRLESGAIIGPDGRRRVIVGEFREELIAPSGHWVVLEGAREEADYIHRALLLLDRRDGSVRALGVGIANTPLTDANLADREALAAGLTAVGESTVRFVPWGGVERLVVDHFLVTPGGETVDLHGTPVF